MATKEFDPTTMFSVVVIESPGEERVAGSWPSAAQAYEQLRAVRRIERRGIPSSAPFPKFEVRPPMDRRES